MNWDEIHHQIHSEHDEDQKYEEEAQRLKGQGLDFAMPGHSDETNQMLDAWMKHHGVMNKEQRTPEGGSAEHHTPFWVPLEHLKQGGSQYSWPEGFGRETIPQIEQEGGYKDKARDVGWNTLWAIQRGQPNPYTDTMREALHGAGYPPEQIQHIMRPQYEMVPSATGGMAMKKIEVAPKPDPDPNLDLPGKDVFPQEWTSHTLAALVQGTQWYNDIPIENEDIFDKLRCPSCGHEVMPDPDGKDMFCVNCDHSFPVGREDQYGDSYKQEYEHPIGFQEVLEQKGPGTLPGPRSIIHPRDRNALGIPNYGKVSELLTMPGQSPVTDGPYREIKFPRNWTPGEKGRGLVINGVPHTWNTWNKESPYPITHPEYVESLGIPAGSVDYNTGVEIDPDGKVLGLGGHSSEPFIAADPRLKHVEGDFFSFGHTMSSFAHTNNMDPYDALWAKEADVAFDQGPLQNTPNPAYSAVVQPSNVGLHGAHTLRRSLLSFLDAHVNGIPVRSKGGEVLSRYGLKRSPEFGQPVTIAVHDPAHLAAAVEAAQHPMGAGSLDQ